MKDSIREITQIPELTMGLDLGESLIQPLQISPVVSLQLFHSN